MGTEHRLELKKKILLHVENSQIVQPRGEPSGQATQALLALFTLSLLVPFNLCLNISYFNYFKGIFHTFFVFL